MMRLGGLQELGVLSSENPLYKNATQTTLSINHLDIQADQRNTVGILGTVFTASVAWWIGNSYLAPAETAYQRVVECPAQNRNAVAEAGLKTAAEESRQALIVRSLAFIGSSAIYYLYSDLSVTWLTAGFCDIGRLFFPTEEEREFQDYLNTKKSQKGE